VMNGSCGAFRIRPLFANKQTYLTAASLLLAYVERAAGFAFGGGMTFVCCALMTVTLPTFRRFGVGGGAPSPLLPLAKLQTLQLRADVSYSVLTPSAGRIASRKNVNQYQMSAIGIAMS